MKNRWVNLSLKNIPPPATPGFSLTWWQSPRRSGDQWSGCQSRQTSLISAICQFWRRSGTPATFEDTRCNYKSQPKMIKKRVRPTDQLKNDSPQRWAFMYLLIQLDPIQFEIKIFKDGRWMEIENIYCMWKRVNKQYYKLIKENTFFTHLWDS